MMGNAETNGKRGTLTAVSWAVTAACWALLLFIIWHVCRSAQSYGELYAGLRAPLPDATAFILGLPGWAYALAAAVITVVLVGKELLLRNKIVAVWINVGLVALGGIVLIACNEFLSFPLIEVARTLSVR